ncbi:MAG: ATP-binding protein, partial [Thermodesulfovibrionales bacterium]
ENKTVPLDTGNYAKITVQDKGTGIPEDHISKIFDPYFTTKQEGSGLGLASAFSIIKNHSGHISVDSELGVGTTFSVYLPASEKVIEHDREKNEALIQGKGRILFMDDEKSLRKAVGAMLNALGFEVELSPDGSDAIDMYKMAEESGKPFELVILDLTVPGGIGGKEVIKKLKDLNPDVKAIVSSGYSSDPIMSNFEDYGFDSVITKPYKIETLSEVLRKVMKEHN